MITTATGNGQETKSHSIEADFANTLYRAAKESFIVASYASQLATHFDLAPEMGYAIGLFHKIGKIILLNLEEEPIDKIRKLTGRKLPRNGLRNQESSLGISANLLGFLQSRHWNIPESIAYPVYFQDNPVASPEKYRPAACLLYLGKLIPDIRSGKEINKSHTVFSTIKYKFDEFLIISEKLTETTELHSDIMTQGRIK